jgi:hypothetical protein
MKLHRHKTFRHVLYGFIGALFFTFLPYLSTFYYSVVKNNIDLSVLGTVYTDHRELKNGCYDIHIGLHEKNTDQRPTVNVSTELKIQKTESHEPLLIYPIKFASGDTFRTDIDLDCNSHSYYIKEAGKYALTLTNLKEMPKVTQSDYYFIIQPRNNIYTKLGAIITTFMAAICLLYSTYYLLIIAIKAIYTKLKADEKSF